MHRLHNVLSRLPDYSAFAFLMFAFACLPASIVMLTADKVELLEIAMR